MVNVIGYSRGNMTMVLIGDRYRKRHEALEPKDDDDPKTVVGKYTARLYIKGIVDACSLYLSVALGMGDEEVKKRILGIDAMIEDLLNTGEES